MNGTPNTEAAAAIALAADPRVHDIQEAMEMIVGEHPEPTPEMTAEIERRLAARRSLLREREESFQRCDTDGFLTQYCDGVSASLEGERARLLRQGGYDTFWTLFKRETGERVPAKLREGDYGFYWTLVDELGRPTGEFYNDSRGKRSKLWKAGYAVLMAWHPAKAKLCGEGFGLSGRAWAAAVQCPHDEREGADL